MTVSKPVPPPKLSKWRSPEGHAVFQPPSSYLALQAKSLPHTSILAPIPSLAPLSVPGINFILDSSIIPSSSQGKVDHHDLMGRSKVTSSPNSIRAPPSLPRVDEKALRRISASVPFPARKIGAGVGAVGMPMASSLDAPEGRHSRTLSNSTADTIKQSSLNNPRQHSRGSSLGQISPVLGAGEIQLRQDPTTVKLLSRLQALSPSSKFKIPPPPPQTCVLHPSILVIPLTIILEALVIERQILKDSYPDTSARLPALRDGSSLQLSTGSLDWIVVKAFVVTMGKLHNSLLPLLSSNSGKEVEELMKSVRQYVGKMKKVFGEIAALYVDKYGFMRGWWDEKGMKGAAGEVGRWGDVFDE